MVVLPPFVTSINFLNLRSFTTVTSIDLQFKSGVKPSIRRTGAELIDFLVLIENILIEMIKTNEMSIFTV